MAAIGSEIASFRETTTRYFQKFINKMRGKLGNLSNPDVFMPDDEDDKGVKENKILLFMLKPGPYEESNASHILALIKDTNYTPGAFEIMNTIMAYVDADDTDPPTLDTFTVFTLLITKDIRLLYNLQPRPDGVHWYHHIAGIWDDDETLVIEDDAERDGVIAIMHGLMGPPHKSGGRKQQNKKSKRQRQNLKNKRQKHSRRR